MEFATIATRDKLLPPEQWLEQSPPGDLEPLFRARRPPRRLQPADNLAQSIQRLAPPLLTHFRVVMILSIVDKFS